MHTLPLAAAASVLLSTTAFAGDWIIDPSHSSAQFQIKHMMVSTVRGEFQKVSGTVKLDEKDITRSVIDVTIDPASINTREPKRDAHLKGADFFDVEKFPTMTFKSTKIQKAKGSALEITGALTIRGVTRQVVLQSDGISAPTKNPWGQLVRGASATGKISRKDFGLNWNKALEAGGVLVGDEVKIELDAELNPAPAATAAGTR